MINSYLHIGDVDYYKIRIKDLSQTPNPTKYTQITKNGVYPKLSSGYYYLNVIEDSYFHLTNNWYFYDINSRYLDQYGSTLFVRAGEYLINPSQYYDDNAISSDYLED